MRDRLNNVLGKLLPTLTAGLEGSKLSPRRAAGDLPTGFIHPRLSACGGAEYKRPAG